MSLRGVGSLLGALASRPHLWLTAVRQTFALAPRGWWKSMPFLPIPAREYVSFRTHTQYGSSRREPEVYDVIGQRNPRAELTLVIRRHNGETVQVPVICRLDTAEEVSIYDAGGVLQRFAQDFLAQTQTTSQTASA